MPLPIARPKLRLPKSDPFGTFWLDRPTQAPAIMRSKRIGCTEDGEKIIVDQGFYFATTSKGPIFDGVRFRRFATPEDALAAIGG